MKTSARLLLLALAGFATSACASGGADGNGPGPTATPSESPAPTPTPSAATALTRVAAGSGFDHGAGLVALPDGRFLVAGTVVGEPGETVHLGAEDDPGRVALLSDGTGAAFVSRHEADGRVAWALLANSDVVADARAVTGVAGGAIVTGTFQGNVAFAGSDLALAGAGEDVFLARASEAGSWVWATRIGGPGNELVEDIATLVDGSVVVAGRYQDGAVFGDAAPVTLSSEQWDDAFVARYSAAGALLWVQTGGGQGNQDALSVAATADGGAVVTGEFQADLVFARGTPGEISLQSAGENDLFLAKLAADGSVAWAKRAGGADEMPGFGERGNDVAVLVDGSILVTGELEGPSTFGAGEVHETVLGDPGDWYNRKMFVARFEPGGSLEWARVTAGVEGDGCWTIGEKILPRENGSFLVFGHFTDRAIFGPQDELDSLGGFDLALASYDPDGFLEWARWAGGPEDQFASDLIWSEGTVLLLGTVRDHAAFGLQSGAQPTFESVGLSDVFAARISP